MINTETLKSELNELTVCQLTSLQYAIAKKLEEKATAKSKSEKALLTDEELDMLAEVMRN
ncbi:hypothetical protein PVK62_04070 [Aliivibrio sp. S3MY1]|uniref:hypothetical protein n=1 Tax=unclassified Aliivibrio TaxID=2645654 RepID=UPI0023780616|nr:MULTISPECIES: hypothetical protein [unclassified Aliivibrio]MDD9195010.1 hypothetical protein [Aliivibrio sp. S3MY1]MDD9198306.1 hypothetical protein [Aliivibrio sp. S2MY1]